MKAQSEGLGFDPKYNGWDQARNILCIRLDIMGDVLMTTPAIRTLKEARTGRKITLLASPGGAGVAPLIPEIDGTIQYAAPWMKATPLRSDSQIEYRLASRLRKEEFDAAVIFTVYSQNPLPAALMCFLAGIPLRLAHCRENPYQLLTHWVKDVYPEDNGRHEVRRQLDLVASVGRFCENSPDCNRGRMRCCHENTPGCRDPHL